MFSLWWRRFLNRMGFRKDTLICMRQKDTWRWSDHLGEITSGHCMRCNAPIYFEKQNRFFEKKVCQRCEILSQWAILGESESEKTPFDQ